MTLPDQCDRVDCQAPVQTFCVLCCRCLCLEHDRLPDGHLCLSSVRFNVSHQLDDDEVEHALEGFRPVP